MIFLASNVLGLTLNIILILGLGGFVVYNILKLVGRIKEKRAKKNKEDGTKDKEI